MAWTSILNTASRTPVPAAAGGQNPDAVASISQSPRAPAPKHLGLAASFGRYLRTLADGVHSGSARTARERQQHRLLSRAADAGDAASGHRLCRSVRPRADDRASACAQTKEAAGVILAVDGQPDGTVSRKRFWRGNFLFAQDPALGGPGFKRFRPIVREANGGLRRLSNEEIAKDPQYGDFSLEQAQARGRRLLRPHGRRDVARAARSDARDDGGDRLARRAGEDARDLGRERPQVSE